MNLRYGFVGLGNLGKHLAVNLTRGGFDVLVNDLHRAAADAVVAAGARWVESIAELAAACDCLITCLPSPAATAAVLEQALPGLRPGQHLDRDEHQRFRRGRDPGRPGPSAWVCPPSPARSPGGVHRAEAGDITVLVGGAQQVFAAHKAALEAMGGRVIHLGGIEQAAVTKVVTNMLAFIHLIAAGEALMLCAKAGRRSARGLRGDCRKLGQ